MFVKVRKLALTFVWDIFNFDSFVYLCIVEENLYNNDMLEFILGNVWKHIKYKHIYTILKEWKGYSLTIRLFWKGL